jgi:hypothetical protein
LPGQPRRYPGRLDSVCPQSKRRTLAKKTGQVEGSIDRFRRRSAGTRPALRRALHAVQAEHRQAVLNVACAD